MKEAVCRYCVFYVNGRCTNKNGTKFNTEIIDPDEPISCIAYIDNAVVFGEPSFDLSSDEMFLF